MNKEQKAEAKAWKQRYRDFGGIGIPLPLIVVGTVALAPFAVLYFAVEKVTGLFNRKPKG